MITDQSQWNDPLVASDGAAVYSYDRNSTISPASTRRQKPTLMERVRDQIGAEGPQLSAEDYEARIDEELDSMSARRLLELISLIGEDEQ